MSSWNQQEMPWNKHAEIGPGGKSLMREKTDSQDGLPVGKISDAINMLVSRMSVLVIKLMNRVYQTPRSRPNCLFYKPPLIVDGEI
jgi:hypothetical protein